MRFGWLLFLTESILLAVLSSSFEIQVENSFKNYFFIHETGFEVEFQDDLVKTEEPKVILRCPGGNCFLAPQNMEGLKKYPRFGPHRFTHIFYKVASTKIIDHWKDLYGRLTLTSSKMRFFNYAATFRTYPFYNAEVFKIDYWRTQWNQDEFVIREAHQLIYDNLHENDNLPTLLQKSVQRPPTLHEYTHLLYNPISGWGGSECHHNTREEQLYRLTEKFNAYDMLFCDVFKHYNLTFKANYGSVDYRWIRNVMLRDDVISSFVPEPNAVFFGSPGVTFILLKEQPIVWDNIFRPFRYFLWGAIGAASGLGMIVFLVLRRVGNSLQQSNSISTCLNDGLILKPSGNLNVTTSTERVWIMTVRISKFVIMASYSGMILAGLLIPSYPWSPTTFKELNESSNFIATIGYDSKVDIDKLLSTYTLNGIMTWRNKVRSFPGSYLIEDELDEKNRYALLMYSDKKFHYIYGKNQLYFTANYIHKIETDKEIVLKEMRYMSVAPGATKMHFLIDSIRRCFETGSWIRWRYLEDNYFKYVVPNTIKNYGVQWVEEELRSLNKLDILTTVYVWAGGLVISGIVVLIELESWGVSLFLGVLKWLVQFFMIFVALVLNLGFHFLRPLFCFCYKPVRVDVPDPSFFPALD